MLNLNKVITIFLIGLVPASWAQTNLPVKIGKVTIVQGEATQRTGIVLGDDDTAYILTMLANGQSHLMRISRKGAVSKLVMFRGWPYILDKHGRIYAFDVSWSTSLKGKIPYMTMRSLKSLPLAIGIGGAVYGVALLDQTFTGFISTENFTPSHAFWGTLLTYYTLDTAHTLFLRSHRSAGDGGNFFKALVAKGVSEFTEDAEFSDYRIISKSDSTLGQLQFLSKVMPSYAGRSDCIEYLTKINMVR
jgi:hypothetical protein